MTENKTEKTGRHIADLKPIEKLQIAVWFDYLLEKSGCKNSKEFDSWLSRKGLLNNELDYVEWSSYEKVARSPSLKTLLAVEELIQGSVARFNELHDTLPLLNVLNGSQVECERVLIEVLGEYKLYKRNMTLRAKCEALFDLVVARSLVIDKQQDKEDELAGIVTGGYFTIEEIMALSVNKVAESFEVGYKKLTTTKFKNASPLIYGQYKILHAKVILAVLSLIHICLASNDSESKLIAYYLVDGITEKALETIFSMHVNNFVKEEF